MDGNDVLAVFEVTKLAREKVMRENMPVLIEAMTYRYVWAGCVKPHSHWLVSSPPSLPSFRLGSHSTSDDQTHYQEMDEVEKWRTEMFPRDRLRGYLEDQQLWGDEQEQGLVSQVKVDIKASMSRYCTLHLLISCEVDIFAVLNESRS